MYGDPVPRIYETQQGYFREGSVKVFGSNGTFATCNQVNTKAPAIIIGRKGSYGKVNWSQDACFASDTTFFVDETTTKQHLRWLFYLFQTLNLDQGTDEAAVPGLNRDDAYEKEVLVPSLVEQIAIANYLDRETAKIDTLISAKERLLDLLTEKRQSLITHFVTHGLNPNVPMRDCGIDWIGKIPKHWNIVQLKRITQKIGSGKTPKGGSEIYLTEGIPLIRSQNVLFTGLVISEFVYITEEIDAEMSSSRVQPYDVLINITGASIGRCCVVPEYISQGNVNQHVCIIRPNFGTIKPEYLNAVLASNVGQTQVFMNQEGISREGLTFEDIGNFWIPLPPQDEQEKLIQSIQKYSSQLSKLDSVTKNTIELLQERRTTLITAAVTRQIKITA